MLASVVIGIFDPVAFHVVRPVTVAFPGVDRRVDAGAATCWGRRAAYPATVLLPTVCVVRSRWGIIHHGIVKLGIMFGIRSETIDPS